VVWTCDALFLCVAVCCNGYRDLTHTTPICYEVARRWMCVWVCLCGCVCLSVVADVCETPYNGMEVDVCGVDVCGSMSVCCRVCLCVTVGCRALSLDLVYGTVAWRWVCVVRMCVVQMQMCVLCKCAVCVKMWLQGGEDS